MNIAAPPEVIDMATARNARIDAELKTDRAFFARWPARTCRLRPLGQAEKAEVMRRGALAPPPPGYIGCAAVMQVRPGFRIRVFFLAAVGVSLDVGEDVALATWRDFTDENTKRFLAFLRQPGNDPFPGGEA